MEWHDNPFNRFLLHPRGYDFADPALSVALGLEPEEHGMLLCVDNGGARWTLVGDAEFVRTLIVAPNRVRTDLALPPEKFALRREGWPDDWQPVPADHG